jgi:vacuolar protein sorting-associated protein 29
LMSDFGELALVVGDFHIPHRAAGIPEKFQRMLVPNKMQRKL